ncbi:MAG TPA: CRISPR-associated ring nuclease Csm6 [Blastocatellia bacterium]|nr:CRISPR-associated ring nuclease Csm6 [Blastocatellia bacterium]
MGLRQKGNQRSLARSRRRDNARHIFVTVLGQTPQVVTETLYALMVERRVPISEIFVITTRVGAERAWRDLLDPHQGQFFAFCREYGFDPRSITFDEHHILTIVKTPASRRARPPTSATSKPGQRADRALEDIRTVEDNRCLAEQLLGFIRQLTENPHTVVHGSIAGGRKTMSAYMLLAFTLYGREQDRLYHVLVPEPFERNPQFFFPPRRERLIGIGVGQVASTREARIDLAEIPFVRLRPWVLKERRVQRTIEEHIRIVQRDLNRRAAEWESLVIDYQARRARWGDRELPITGVKLALLAYFAERRAEHRQHGRQKIENCPHCFSGFSDFDLVRYEVLYRRFVPAETRKGKIELGPDLFLSYRAKLNRVLTREGFPPELQIVNISTTPRNARYGLRLDPRRIRLESHPGELVKVGIQNPAEGDRTEPH